MGGNPTIVKAYPVSMIKSDIRVYRENDSDSRIEPYVGLEFNSPDDAREFYGLYAMRVGFRVRTGQLYRSRTDGSVASRRFVCSKEGFQLNSRTGCPAFIRVQRRDLGKWVIDQIHKDHNHELGVSVENDQVDLDGRIRIPSVVKSECEVSQRKKIKFLKEGGGGSGGGVLSPSGVVSAKRFKREGDGGVIAEPYSGLVFNSADDAYDFYQAYAESVGFRVRIGQLFRSKSDGSITSRRFVCSKEGFQHPSRVGCGAFMRIKNQDCGTWIVDKVQKDHNHDFDHQIETPKKSALAPKKLMEEVKGRLECLDFTQANHGGLGNKNQVDINWYPLLLDYFQSRQAQDTGFFYAVEVSDGSCMSVFWADGRSRFSCSQFGDAITFDTSYRRSNYTVPLAIFVGVNHHKQPVLLGCALIANESKESLTWLFQTWQRAMSGCRPKSIIADQDLTIQQAISQVFPGTHHRFSTWQIKAKEQEFLRLMTSEFRYDYEKCIYQCQTSAEFNTLWNALINKYGLKDNTWLKYMYEKRKNWVPLYLRESFFAGIPINGSVEPFFGPYLNEQISPKEFVSRYEQELELRREEERKEDYNSSNLQAFLQTKEPVEEQCRRIYTLTVFRIFQNELLQSYNYLAMKSYEEGSISRYSVRRCGNESDKHAVTFSASNYIVGCSCQMFEFEGVLCKHILRVFSLLDIREIPSCYLLHRWTRNAEFGTVYNIESVVNSQELRSLMVWSLREASSKYIESATSSFEKYKVAYDILREGERKLSWHR